MPCQAKPPVPETANTCASAFRLMVWGLSLLLVTSCGHASREESRVCTAAAKIDGITCPTCVPPLTAALRRQFDKAAAVDVDEKRETATVQLGPQQDFSPAAFRHAVERVQMRVKAFRIEACGRMEARGDQRWLTAGSSRFLVHGGRELPLNQPLCIKGGLDASRDPFMLDVTTFELQHD